jgi:hypothetical protein
VEDAGKTPRNHGRSPSPKARIWGFTSLGFSVIVSSGAWEPNSQVGCPIHPLIAADRSAGRGIKYRRQVLFKRQVDKI